MKTENKKKEQLTDKIRELSNKIEELEKFKKKCESEKEAYQYSQANLHALIENAKNSIWSVDRAYRILTINSHFKREFSAAFGINLEEGMTITDYVPPEMSKIWIRRYERALKGENFTVEDEFKVGDRIISTEISFNPIRHDKQITGVSVFARDVTERRQAEEALRESEERFKILFQSAPDAYYLSDLKGTLIDGNKMAEKLTGYKKEELVGKSFLKLRLLPPTQIPKAAKLLMKNTEGISTGPDEFRLHRKDGTKAMVGISTHPVKIKDQTLILGIARDITERKRAEEAIKESEEKFRMLAEKSPNMIFINKKGRIVYANQQCEEVMGYRREEFYSPDFDFFSMIEPDSIGIVKANFQKHIKGDEVSPYEYSLITKAGKKIDAIVTTKLISFGGESAILGIITDITERKQAEEALRKSEEKYRHLVENTNEVLYATDENGIITYISPVAKTLSGYSPSEVMGKNFMQFVFKEDMEVALKNFQKNIKGKPEPSECRIVTKSGDLKWIRSSDRPIFLNELFLGVQGVLSDITDQKRAEEEIKASLKEKEAMMREIHHRVKNNLQIVSSLLRLQARSIKSKTLIDTFEIAQNRIKSMALIHEVLYLSENLDKINFSDYIKRITNHLFAMFSRKAKKIKLELDVGEYYLDIDKAIPCGLIINELVSNAFKHAFPDGKTGKIQVYLNNKLDRYTVVVKDTGVGFPDDVDMNNTETLGLQLVNDLVKQIEGAYQLQRDGGTTFKIVF
ncbi:MAG: PAS domain S-box protein [Candidatus Aminicenantes bacterium]|nr:MAG: PAS domain S-box protein [Candidatus Aminicenantes bacterium]